MEASSLKRWKPFSLLIFYIFLVVGYCALIYLPFVKYPFTFDDWSELARLSKFHPSLTNYLQFFEPVHNGVFFRPLWLFSIHILYAIFGYHYVGFHVVFFILHVANAFLLVYICRHLGVEQSIAWAVGLLYAVAFRLHGEPFVWFVSVNIFAGYFFLLLSFVFHFNKKTLAAAAFFMVALLCRESFIFFPFLFLALSWIKTRKSDSDRNLSNKALWEEGALYLVIFLLYLTFKMRGRLPSGHGEIYAMGFAPEFLLRKCAAFYAIFVESLLPAFHFQITKTNVALHFFFFCTVIGLAFDECRREKNLRTFLIFILWGIVGLLPAMPLRHVMNGYYLAFSYPAFLVLLMFAIKRALSYLRLSGFFNPTVWVLTIISATLSLNIAIQMDKSPLLANDYSGNQITQAKTVKIVWGELKKLRPELPDGTVLLFDGINIRAFDREVGVQQWYQNPSLKVFELKYLVEEGHSFYIRNEIRYPAFGFLGNTPETPIDPKKTLIVRYRDGELKIFEFTADYLEKQKK